jgi:phosphatidylglycerophosphate synthase
MPVIKEAIVVCPQEEAPESRLLEERVAGLPALARTLLTARHAGIERVVVLASETQMRALRGQVDGDARLRSGVEWRAAEGPLEAGGPPRLLLVPWVIANAGMLRRRLGQARGTRAVAVPANAAASPVVAAPDYVARCAKALRSGQAGWAGLVSALNTEGQLERMPSDEPHPRVIRSADEIPAVERAMLEATRSPEDGLLVDRWVNRRASSVLSQWLARTRVTPNQVTAASLATGMLGAWLLGQGGPLATLTGLALFQLSVILDHVDGELARLKFHFSRLGKWIDNIGDHVVDLAVILFVAWRAAVASSSEILAALGAVAGIGVTGAFLLVFWWSVSGGLPQPPVDGSRAIFARGLRALANRDGFCLPLWATMLLNRPEWLLWTFALGANAYWILGLLVFGVPQRAGAERAAHSS